jgi:hypothetical protein
MWRTGSMVHVFVDTVEDTPAAPRKVGDAFRSVLSLLGGNEEGEERHVVPRDLVRWKQFWTLPMHHTGSKSRATKAA